MCSLYIERVFYTSSAPPAVFVTVSPTNYTLPRTNTSAVLRAPRPSASSPSSFLPCTGGRDGALGVCHTIELPINFTAHGKCGRRQGLAHQLCRAFPTNSGKCGRSHGVAFKSEPNPDSQWCRARACERDYAVPCMQCSSPGKCPRDSQYYGRDSCVLFNFCVEYSNSAAPSCHALFKYASCRFDYYASSRIANTDTDCAQVRSECANISAENDKS